MDKPLQSIESRLQAVIEALDNLDTQDRKSVRDTAEIVRWAKIKIEREKLRQTDVMKNLIVVCFTIFATVIGGIILTKLK